MNLIKKHGGTVLFTVLLLAYTVFVLLDTFVIPKGSKSVETASATSTTAAAATDPVVTDTSYSDGTKTISIETAQVDGTTYYVADIQLTSADQLKTAFAQNTYGRNIKETTSQIASDNGAVLAINGDYYGFRDGGYVVRNGTGYRDTARSAGDDAALVVDTSGNFSIINESETALSAVSNAWQVFCFGPALIKDSQIVVDANSEVDQSMTTNPRTAIGQVGNLHYICVVSDGRTDASKGLSLLELAQIMKDKGCSTAYNLDGGGSSTMVFNGSVVNQPTTNGDKIQERAVSDIVWF
ncbi:MAG: phosphodiester glycosidase family protein [Eubacteriaceae bacterium]|nr:phosphodiester glycosidase family protein [Eubacteriaceae bacterium]